MNENIKSIIKSQLAIVYILLALLLIAVDNKQLVYIIDESNWQLIYIAKVIYFLTSISVGVFCLIQILKSKVDLKKVLSFLFLYAVLPVASIFLLVPTVMDLFQGPTSYSGECGVGSVLARRWLLSNREEYVEIKLEGVVYKPTIKKEDSDSLRGRAIIGTSTASFLCDKEVELTFLKNSGLTLNID